MPLVRPSPSRALFAALMRQLGFLPPTKEEGLREFQRRGWVLVDATYEPVNKLSRLGRDRVIERDYPLLRDDLEGLSPDRSTPLVLIKANVCRTLAPKLEQDGPRSRVRARPQQLRQTSTLALRIPKEVIPASAMLRRDGLRCD